MLTQFDEICQRKDDLEKRCIQRHESPLPALKTRIFYHRDGYNKRYARYAVAYAAEKTIDPEKPKATSKTASISEKSRKAPYAPNIKLIDSLPEDIRWRERKDGSLESVRGDYPCQVTNHKKSHGAAQYFQHSFFVIPKFWCDVMSGETQNFDRIS